MNRLKALVPSGSHRILKEEYPSPQQYEEAILLYRQGRREPGFSERSKWYWLGGPEGLPIKHVLSIALWINTGRHWPSSGKGSFESGISYGQAAYIAFMLGFPVWDSQKGRYVVEEDLEHRPGYPVPERMPPRRMPEISQEIRVESRSQSVYILTKSFRFEASHRLPNHDGKCRRLHGHSWKGTVVIEAPETISSGPKTGMVMDYSDISAILDPLVEDYLDHYHLNDSLSLVNPTSEEIARWICNQLKPDLPALAAVIIEETCTSSCEYRPEATA